MVALPFPAPVSELMSDLSSAPEREVQDPVPSDPFVAEILEVDERIKQVQEQIRDLATTYRDQACQRIGTYVLERVRHTCTQEYPDRFLALSPSAQTSLMGQIKLLATELSDHLRQVDLKDTRDPWLALEEAIAPHLEATQQVLDQLYEQTQISSGSDSPLSPLRWLEMEMADPELKGLRAYLQVSVARQARLERQRGILKRKQQIAAAETRWGELETPGHFGAGDVTITTGSSAKAYG